MIALTGRGPPSICHNTPQTRKTCVYPSFEHFRQIVCLTHTTLCQSCQSIYHVSVLKFLVSALFAQASTHVFGSAILILNGRPQPYIMPHYWLPPPGSLCRRRLSPHGPARALTTHSFSLVDTNIIIISVPYASNDLAQLSGLTLMGPLTLNTFVPHPPHIWART